MDVPGDAAAQRAPQPPQQPLLGPPASGAGLGAVYSWLDSASRELGGLFAGASASVALGALPPARSQPSREHPADPAASGSAGRQPPDERGAPAQQGAQDAGRGDRGLRPGPPPGRRRYEVDREDLLDQHVGYYLRHHPEVHAEHTIARKCPGVYDIDGREVTVEWQYAAEPGGQGHLVAVDGPLRQPFSDYMEMTEENAEYEMVGVASGSSLHSIPRDQRMSFNDQHKMFSRLEAMKVAKEQALVRERAADYVRDGREVPGELLQKYKRVIQQKLDPGGRRMSGEVQQLPPPASGAGGGPAPEGPPAARDQQQAGSGQGGQGYPPSGGYPPPSAEAPAADWPPAAGHGGPPEGASRSLGGGGHEYGPRPPGAYAAPGAGSHDRHQGPVPTHRMQEPPAMGTAASWQPLPPPPMPPPQQRWQQPPAQQQQYGQAWWPPQ